MKKLGAALGFLCIALCAVAQTAPSTLDASQAVEAPPAGIDLLKQAFSNSSSAVPTAGNTAAPQKYVAPASSSVPVPAASVTPVAMPPSQTKIISSATPVEKEIETKNALAEGEKAASSASQTAKPEAKTETKPEAKTNTKKVTPAKVRSKSKPKVKEKQVEKAVKPVEKPAAQETETPADAERIAQDAVAQEELDDAARMMRQAKQDSTSGRFIPQSPSQVSQPEAEAKERVYNPNSYRPGVQWQRNDSTHFEIYNQKRSSGIGSANMALTFESAYTTLRRYIPWMMSGKVRVFVYQDHDNYLKHEPHAKAWTRALAYPIRGEIVVYDEPGKQQELQEVFTHELVHIFTQQFFDKHNSGQLVTPTWLDEGLAVYVEDQAYRGSKGGPWNHDFKTLNFKRSKETEVTSFGSTSMFGSSRGFSGLSARNRRGKPIYFMPFDAFMQEGSLAALESQHKTQDWYFQAYVMVRFLLNPAGGVSPSNRMQFEQFTRLIAQGEQVRDPQTGFLARDEKGNPVYQLYSVEKALGRAYRYNTIANFEDAFWRWANQQ